MIKFGWGPFAEHDGKLSMTRLVAWMFAVTVCYAIIRMASQDHAHDMGWPFVALGICTLLAVPLQAFFRFLNSYIKTRPGAAMLNQVAKKIGDKVGIAVPDLVQPTPTTATINVHTPPEE